MTAAALIASRYNTFTESAEHGTFLAFNAFTGALLELDAEEFERVAILEGRPGSRVPTGLPSALRDRLIAAGIVVPDGFDERAALFDLRRRALDAPDSLLLTLAPTIQCNFRCTYCFETHRQEVMTPAIEHDLVRFIAQKAEGVRAINTTWFGGEPLLRLDTIERVQRFINELGEARGITVVHSIITNGYFLTADFVARLQALGAWEMAQVTIDGPPQVHDNRRMLVGGGGTWNRVIENCLIALNGGMHVAVRVNVDRRNVTMLGPLLDRLIEERVVPAASVSLGFVTDATSTCAHVAAEVLSDEERARIALWFEGEKLRRHLPPSAVLPSPQCGPLCVVESKLGYVVAPSGLIFKCWNQVDRSEEEAIGHVSGRSVPNATTELERWTRYDPSHRSGCSNCSALPACMGGCPWEYERLGRIDHGECGSYRFFPREVVKLAHVRLRLARSPAG